MEIRTVLKEWSENTKQWVFNHARRDYQNHQEITDFIYSESSSHSEGQTFLFLDPVVRRPLPNGVRYIGNFMILTNSDIDKDYDQKYQDYIEPLLDIFKKELFNLLRCSYDINNLSAIEVINVFDFNADGISVSFDLTGY